MKLSYHIALGLCVRGYTMELFCWQHLFYSMILTVVCSAKTVLMTLSPISNQYCNIAQLIGINTVSNLTCEESELTPNDYIKIIWTAAAELPGMKLKCW